MKVRKLTKTALWITPITMALVLNQPGIIFAYLFMLLYELYRDLKKPRHIPIKWAKITWIEMENEDE